MRLAPAGLVGHLEAVDPIAVSEPDLMLRLLGGKGEFAIITGALSAVYGSTQDSSYSARQLAADRVLQGFFAGPWTNLFVGYGYRESPRYVGAELVAAAHARLLRENRARRRFVFVAFPERTTCGLFHNRSVPRTD